MKNKGFPPQAPEPTNPSLSRSVIITNPAGLHARPAVRIAKLAAGAQGPFRLVLGSQRVDATDSVEILSLGATCGTMLRLEIENPQDQDLLIAMGRLFETGFKE